MIAVRCKRIRSPRRGAWRGMGYLMAVVAVLVSSGCETMVPEQTKATVVVGQQGEIFIVDATGKRWDVTHAVNAYGFVAADFEFGIGPDAIRPINNPIMVSPGESGYPGSDKTFLVIGTTLMGESRAYAINHLNPHEVVNEKFNDLPVAVGW